MLVQTFEKERKKIYEEGKAEGAEVQRQTLLRFAHWRFATNEAEQTQLAQHLAKIHNLQHLGQLSEILLQVNTFAEFSKWVATYVPAATEKPAVTPKKSSKKSSTS